MGLNSETDPTLEGDHIITKEFLQKALQKEANGGPVPEILSHTTTLGTKPGDNYMSIIYSIDVKLDNGTTRHLIVKCYPNHPSRQQFMNKSNIFFKECEIYSKWMPELRRLQTEVVGLTSDQAIKLPYAHFIHGECINFHSPEVEARKSGNIDSLDNFILMEDIRKTSGFRMTNRREPLDIDHMRLVIKALAEVHSLSWAYRHHVEPNITQKFPYFLPKKDVGIWSSLLSSNLDHAKAIYDKEFGPGNEYSAAADNFAKHSSKVENYFTGKYSGDGMEKLFRVSTPDSKIFGKDSDNPETWRIICHGDCWSNNFLFRYDPETDKPVEIVLVDLPMAQETCVVNDLEFVIFQCTDLEFRRSYTDELLKLYHDTFNEVCKLLKTPTLPGFSMDSIRFRYHRGKFFGYYMAIVCLPSMLQEEEKAVDMEDMESDKNISDVLTGSSGSGSINIILKRRLIGLTQGMIEDGVL